MAADARKNGAASWPSDLHGAAAILLLQLIALFPFLTIWPFCRLHLDACAFRQHSYWDFSGLGLSGIWLLLTATFERSNLYSNHRNSCLCIVYSVVAASDALQVCESPQTAWRNSVQTAWRNSVLKCILPGLVNPLAHQSSGASLVARIVSHFFLFSFVAFRFGGVVVALTTVPILISALISGGLLAAHRISYTETTRGGDLGDRSEKGTATSGAQVKGANRVAGPSPSKVDPNVAPSMPANHGDSFGPQSRDSFPAFHSREVGLETKMDGDTWVQSLKADPSASKGGADYFSEGGGDMGGANRERGCPQEDHWDVSDAFGGSGLGGRAKRRRGRKLVQEKTRKRAPAEVAIVMGAEVSRLVSVSKVMEIDDAQEFIVRAQVIMSDTAVRGLQENARFDSRVAKPMRFPDEMALELAARTSGSVDPSAASERERLPLPRGPRQTSPVDAGTTSGSQELTLEVTDGDAGPVPTSLYERARRCVNRLGYEWAALKWEESQVEVRALGALKEAVLGRRAEDDVMRAVNLVRDARLGLAMLATASSRLQPWHALERRGCRAGLLFGPLWVTPLLAKDAGRAAWVAQACRTEGLVGESVNRVFPQLGMGQARALAAVCRDMERVETQLEAELTKLRTAIRPWLRGTQVNPSSVTGLVLGNLGDEVERLALQADALQLQLFQQCTQILTPLQLGTLLLALMDQRMRLQRLGSFWESVAAGQDVMTGVRKLTGRMANFNA